MVKVENKSSTAHQTYNEPPMPSSEDTKARLGKKLMQAYTHYCELAPKVPLSSELKTPVKKIIVKIKKAGLDPIELLLTQDEKSLTYLQAELIVKRFSP